MNTDKKKYVLRYFVDFKPLVKFNLTRDFLKS